MGARRSALVRLVVLEGLGAIAAGMTAGLLLSAWLMRFTRAMLFGVAPLDPISFAGALAILLGTGVLACALPALRAASTDPATALRMD